MALLNPHLPLNRTPLCINTRYIRNGLITAILSLAAALPSLLAQDCPTIDGPDVIGVNDTAYYTASGGSGSGYTFSSPSDSITVDPDTGEVDAGGDPSGSDDDVELDVSDSDGNEGNTTLTIADVTQITVASPDDESNYLGTDDDDTDVIATVRDDSDLELTATVLPNTDHVQQAIQWDGATPEANAPFAKVSRSGNAMRPVKIYINSVDHREAGVYPVWAL